MRRITRRTALGGAAALVLGGSGTLPAAAAPGLANSGFEQGLDGWKVLGDARSAKIESGGRTGDRLTHWAAADYRVTTRQTVELPSRGWWTVSVWAKSGGALNASTLAVKGCGPTARP